MKLFCECNSTIKEQYEFFTTESSIRKGIRRKDAMFKGNEEVLPCTKCGLFPWIDADYENMMLDLKHMNE